MSMFTIYIRNWKNGNELVSAETAVFTIPMEYDKRPWITNPVVKGEMGKAESFDFTIHPGEEYYDAFLELKTIVRVDYHGDNIFFGRVLTVNTSGLLQIRSIHCEGVFAALGDTPQEGMPEDEQSEITARQHFERVISRHNTWIDKDKEPWKEIETRNIEIEIDGEARKCLPTSWSTTLSELDSLVDKHGGYMRVCCVIDSNGKEHHYLEWRTKFFRDLGDQYRPKIRITKNLIDLSTSSDVGEIFTRLIPVGKTTTTSVASNTSSSGTRNVSNTVYVNSKKYLRVIDIRDHFSDQILEADGFHKVEDYLNAEDDYGIIYRTESFENAESDAQLEKYAWDWIRRNYYTALRTFNVKAVDMYMVGESGVPKILVGDVVDITYPTYDKDGNTTLQTKKLVCKAIQYNLLNPEANTYTLGVPNDIVDFEYGSKSNKTKKASSTAAQANKSSVGPSDPGSGDDKGLSFNAIYQYIMYYYTTRRSMVEGYPNSAAQNDAHAQLLRKYLNCDFASLDNYKRPYFPYVYPNSGTHEFPDQNPAKSFYNNGRYKPVTKTETLADGRIVTNTTFEKVEANFQDTGNTANVPKEYASTASFKGVVFGHYWYGTQHLGVGVRDGACAFTFYWTENFSNSNVISTLFYFPVGSIKIAASKTAGDANSADEGPINKENNRILQKGEDGVERYYYAVADPNDNGKMKTAIDYSNENNFTNSGYMPDGTWYLRLPEPITITTENGNEVELGPGVYSEKDFSVREVKDFKVETAIATNSVSDRATIGHLRAVLADVGDYHDVDVSDVDLNEIFEGEYLSHRDENGNIIYDLDKDGNKIPIRDSSGKPVVKIKEGSIFHNTQQHIQGVTGRFTRVGNDIHVISGGSFYLDRDNASYGIWDKGELKAGIFSDRDKGGKTITTVKGDHIVIGTVGTEDIYLADALYIDVQHDNHDLVINRGLTVSGDIRATRQLILSDDGKLPAQVFSKQYIVRNGGFLQFGEGDDPPTLRPTNVGTIITDLKLEKLSGTTKYQLFKKTIDNTDWTSMVNATFNTAASLSGEWSSSDNPYRDPRKLTIYAYPTGESYKNSSGVIIDDVILNRFTIGFNNSSSDIDFRIMKNYRADYVGTNYPYYDKPTRTFWIVISIVDSHNNVVYATPISVNGQEAYTQGHTQGKLDGWKDAFDGSGRDIAINSSTVKCPSSTYGRFEYHRAEAKADGGWIMKRDAPKYAYSYPWISWSDT